MIKELQRIVDLTATLFLLRSARKETFSRSSDLSQHKLLGRVEKWCRGHPGNKFAMYHHPAVYQDNGTKAATPVQLQEDHLLAS